MNLGSMSRSPLIFPHPKGGLVALFTGMSVLSLFEVVIWLLQLPKVLSKKTLKKL